MADNLSTTTAGCTFFLRLGALPVVADSISKAKEIYIKTQNYRSVGVVVSVAESSIRAASRVLPLTTPLLSHVGGWPAVNEWACQGLDKVQTWAPVVCKPTAQVVDELREKLLNVLAGEPSQTSITDAVVFRAANTILLLSNTRGGRIAVEVATMIVDNANTLVDAYLPPVQGEPKENGSDGLVVKTSTLALKTRRRLYHTTHIFLHPDVTCVNYSTSHLAHLIRSWATEWCKAKLQEIPPRMTPINFSIFLARNATGKVTLNFHKLLAAASRLTSASDAAATQKSYTGFVPARLQHLLVHFIVCLKAFFSAALQTSLESWVTTEHYLRRTLAARNKDSATEVTMV
ncbi:uncharacterized protein [Cherax quadricarinatus]|uniref:uncharacterized protein isoform X1 n=1 Tax=Cherax quadricarinatus TaxID=27406 RepID=UPI00387EBF9B